jgi:hypothetical protein
LIVAASLLLAQPVSVWATPPIEGDTLDFAAKTDVGASTDSVYAVALGDLDDDGDLDAVSGSGAAENLELIVWRNDGMPYNGTWTAFDAGLTSANIRSLSLGDLDNDGDLDIVAGTDFAGAAAEIVVWQNMGAPFAGGWALTDLGQRADTVDSIVLGDLDNDGDLDLVSDGVFEITAWENDGSPFAGVWAGNDIGVTGDDVRGLALGDLDGNGLLDAVSASEANEDYEIIAWQNDGTPFSGAWGQTDVGATTTSSLDVALGDLDNDGDLDIVSAGDEGLRLRENDGAPFGGGLWAGTLVSDSGSANRLSLHDLDGDGDLDIASGHTVPSELRAWQNDDAPFSSSWSESELGNVSGFVTDLALGDLDNDGDLDYLASFTSLANFELTAWQNTHVHRNAPFAPQGFAVGAVEMNVLTLAQGDLDEDGDLDVISAGVFGASFDVVAWQNTGAPFDAAWTSGIVAQIPHTVTTIALGDLDNDGDLDLVTGTVEGADFEIMAWENGLDPFAGPWDSGNVGAVADSVGALALADLDNDGDLDIVSGAGLNAFEVMVWMNDGTPFDNTWIQNGVGESLGHVTAVAVGDLDNDGNVDIVTGSTAQEDFEIIAWRNDDLPFAGLWDQNDVGPSGGAARSLALGDLDNDGDLDIMSGSTLGAIVEIVAWQNNGDPFGVLWPSFQVGASPDSVYAVQLGDLDGDGDLDLVTGSGVADDFEVTAWENDGGPLSGSWPATDIGAIAGDVYAVVLGDLDNDGDLDVVSGSGEDAENQVVAWKNIGGSARLAPRDEAPDDPILDSNEAAVLSLVFTHNGDAGDHDLELNYLNLRLMQTDCATPLNDVEANALVDNLRLRLDDGDLVFETSDTLVADIGALILNGGVQPVVFANGDPNVRVAVGASKLYWVSLLTTSDATAQSPGNLCMLFDPDADALVEARGTADYSASIQDIDTTSPGFVLITPAFYYIPLILG